MGYVVQGNLSVDTLLHDFINTHLLPAAGINPKIFWEGFDGAVHELAPRNAKLLAKRAALQKKINEWLQTRPADSIDSQSYIDFLKEIGYIVEEGDDFVISTDNVDDEIARIAGPQLVVPVMNARYALNAANARWGSLYDALYGTDILPEDKGAEKTASYNPVRGKHVIAHVRKILDETAPLLDISWQDVTGFHSDGEQLVIEANTTKTKLQHPEQFVGISGSAHQITSILLKNNNLHIDIIIDKDGMIGRDDSAGINDVVLESALSTIMDCEDSIAAVDAADKVEVYTNWLGLMTGDLSAEVKKGDKVMTRTLNPDRHYIDPAGKPFHLHGRSLMLVRNVGHLMTNPAVLLKDKSEIPEGIMDAFMTVLGAIPDLKRNRNSRCNSLYIVKPKMHGPEEVAFACDIFSVVESILGVKKNTLKIGIMDEERRTTVNLKESIRVAAHRVFFINTGFLDRTGDEIHTSMRAGPMIRKNDMKQSIWIKAYEDWNVDIGLACGFSGKAQIGKGMWAMPDMMADMMTQKIAHPQAGANCAWVPSPTAATLHALHYHQLNVFTKQAELTGARRAKLEDILTLPITKTPHWSDKEISSELENNAQSILGYVVRWIDQGIGCSKVPDINDVGLMEDRATLRISSQHIANWLHHDICTKEDVMTVMKKMAAIVDGQNKHDPAYQAMSDDFDKSIAFKAACDLVFAGADQPSGYTEPILHAYRLKKKQQHA